MTQASSSGHVAFLHEVRRGEDREQDLRGLGRLDREAVEPDPDPRAVHLAYARRQHRGKDEQEQPDQRERVGVALQHSVVADHDEHRDEHRYTDGGPHHLRRGERAGEGLAGLLGLLLGAEVEPVDHHEAEPVE
jgi:hypothetical protein